MRTLPLYITGNAPRTEVERTEPLDRDSFPAAGANGLGRACDRCALGGNDRLRSPCLPGQGMPGGLLVIGEGPGKNEDSQGMPFAGPAGAVLRKALKEHWSGAVAFDSATRCYAMGTEVKEAHVKQCRGFLTGTLAEVAPTRVLIIGGWAAYSVFGRAVPMYSTRKGYGWIRGNGPRPIPAFFLLNPAAGLRNRFVAQWFRDDIKWALTSPEPPVGPWRSETRIVETAEDAELAARELLTHDWVSFDVETHGRMWNADFVVTRVSVCGDGDEEPFTWEEKELYDPAIRAPLMRVLASKALLKRHVPKTGANVKYDQLSIRAAFGVEVGPICGDVRLTRKLLEPEASARLAHMVELVGMGGMKGDAEEGMVAAVGAVKRAIRKHWRDCMKVLLKDPRAALPELPVPLADLGFPLHPAIDASLRAIDDAAVADLRVSSDYRATAEEHGWRLDDAVDTYQYSLLAPEKLTRYNARDTVGAARVEHYTRAGLEKKPNLRNIWEKVVLPGARALERVEAWGVGADVRAIKAFDHFLGAREARLKTTLDQYGPDTNWDSVPQVRELLFKKLGLKPVHETKKGGDASTGKATLTALADQHPLPKALLDYRFVSKLRGNYAVGMLPHVRDDGRIHPNIKLDGARCALYNTLILTNRGYIPVQDVRIGDQVLAHTGKPRAVTDAWQEPPTPIYCVRLENGLELRTTGNHPYRVGDGWVRADALALGDAVAVHSDPEEWRLVVDWPTYEVSSWGRVRNRLSGLVLAQAKSSSGHLQAGLWQSGKHKTFKVHVLMAAAFIGPRPKGHEVRHLNGIPWDNTVRNLAYGTAHENRQDARRHGVLSQRRAGRTKLTQEQVDTIRTIPRHEGVPSRAKLAADVLAAFAKRRAGKYGELTAFAREHGVSPQLVNMALKTRIPQDANARSDQELAEEYGVTRETIKDIRVGKRWPAEDYITGIGATFSESLVVSVALEAPEVTFSLTVEEDASHVTAGIVTHNSGRTSCVAPNLQNIPRPSTVEGKMARDCFVAREGFMLLEVDYSQLELRIAAMLSGDPVMLEIFASGVDYHLRTAQLVSRVAWGIGADEVTDAHRSLAKGVNFGVLYGKTANTFANEWSVSRQKAQQIVDAVMGNFKHLQKWCAARENEAQKTGEVYTWWAGEKARHRPLWRIADADDAAASVARNGARNSPVQGTASEFCIASLAQAVQWIEDDGLENDLLLCLPVHDSLLFEVRTSMVGEVAHTVKEIMLGHDSRGVPLEVDFKEGKSWGSMTKRKV